MQKKNINNFKVKWIKNFNNIKKGPIIFFGNEFFDAIPINQYIKIHTAKSKKKLSLSMKSVFAQVKERNKPSIVAEKIRKLNILIDKHGNLQQQLLIQIPFRF